MEIPHAQSVAMNIILGQSVRVDDPEFTDTRCTQHPRNLRSDSSCPSATAQPKRAVSTTPVLLAGMLRASEKVEAAVEKLLSEGRTLTYDLIGEVKAARCSEVGAAVEERLRIA